MTTILIISGIIIFFIWRYSVNLNSAYPKQIEQDGRLIKKHEKLINAVQKAFENEAYEGAFNGVQQLGASELLFEVLESNTRYYVKLIDKPSRYFFEVYDADKKLIRKYNSAKDQWSNIMASEMLWAIQGGEAFHQMMGGQSFE